MNEHTSEHREHGFAIGLMAGAVVGAGLTMWFAPRVASSFRRRFTKSVKSFGKQASKQYQQASSLVGETVDELTRKGQGIRNEVADAVAHGAHEVERFAAAAKSDSRR